MRTAGSVLLWILMAITGVVALALLVAMVATQDTPNALGWAIFFGCLIAAPLLGLAAWNVRSSRPCPVCGKAVKKGLVTCPTCGFDFSAMVPRPQGGSVPEPVSDPRTKSEISDIIMDIEEAQRAEGGKWPTREYGWAFPRLSEHVSQGETGRLVVDGVIERLDRDHLEWLAREAILEHSRAFSYDADAEIRILEDEEDE